MVRNFIGVIIVVGIIIALVSQGDTLWQHGKDFLAKKQVQQENIKQPESKDENKISEHDSQSLSESNLDASKDLPLSVESTDPEIIPSEEIPEDEPVERTLTGVVDKGDTIIELINDFDNPNRIHEIIKSTEGVFSPKKFRIGQPYSITYNVEENSILKFEYEIDKFEKLIIEVKDEKPRAYLEDIVYEKKLAYIKGNIQNNLFQAIDDAGETPQLAFKIADIFAWEINFIRDIQENDSFAILVEKLYREGDFKGYGRALGAVFNNNNVEYNAYLFYDSKKIENYYSSNGNNLKKVLLQSPLSFTRVTSGYSRSRKHPIFGDYRPHLGIDYGAPKGTPVMAVGAGTVKIRGWVGGYGYQVMLVHSSGFESMYSHLSGFARKLKKGSKVRQGQIIGYVGSTGNSTGPHLDFRLKRYGKFINPASAMSPRAEPISKKDKQAFDDWIVIVKEFMDGTRLLDSYSTDLLKANI